MNSQKSWKLFLSLLILIFCAQSSKAQQDSLDNVVKDSVLNVQHEQGEAFLLAARDVANLTIPPEYLPENYKNPGFGINIKKDGSV